MPGFFPCFFLSSSTKCWLGVFSMMSASYNHMKLPPLFSYIIVYICCVVLQGCPRPITFYELALSLVICPFPDIVFSEWLLLRPRPSNAYGDRIIIGILSFWQTMTMFTWSILFSLSASYNLIIFYELALLLVICPFPAILFSLCASYNLIIFYELALSLVICPFPAILFS